MKFDLLSRNSIILLEELISDQTLAKLISINTTKPLDADDIKNTGSLILKNIFPTPYNSNVPIEQKVELRAFFSNGLLQNKEVLNTQIYFQLILHRDLWLIETKDSKGEYQKRIRPYDIMDRIVSLYENKSIGTLGKLNFEGFSYDHVDKDYGFYTLVANMMTL